MGPAQVKEASTMKCLLATYLTDFCVSALCVRLALQSKNMVITAAFAVILGVYLGVKRIG